MLPDQYACISDLLSGTEVTRKARSFRSTEKTLKTSSVVKSPGVMYEKKDILETITLNSDTSIYICNNDSGIIIFVGQSFRF